MGSKIHTKTKMEIGRTCSENEGTTDGPNTAQSGNQGEGRDQGDGQAEGQQMDQTLYRVAIKEREEIKGTAEQNTARRHSKEGGNHPEQESIRQTTMEGICGVLHPAVDGQSLSEVK